VDRDNRKIDIEPLTRNALLASSESPKKDSIKVYVPPLNLDRKLDQDIAYEGIFSLRNRLSSNDGGRQ
jgi:hypothetical protein